VSIGGTAQESGGQGIWNGQVEELVVEHFLYSHAVFGVLLKHFEDEVFGHVRDGDMVGEGVVAHLDLAVGGLDVVGLEGRPSYQTGVGDYSETPDVDLVGVTDIDVV
jgi:hypothetical protein